MPSTQCTSPASKQSWFWSWFAYIPIIATTTFFEWSRTHYSDIVSAIPSGSIYGRKNTCYLTFFLAYTLAFYLTFFLVFFLASILAFYLATIQVSIMAFYLASILTYPASNEIWHPQLKSGSPLSPGARGEGEGNSNKIQRPLPGRWEKMKHLPSFTPKRIPGYWICSFWSPSHGMGYERL